MFCLTHWVRGSLGWKLVYFLMSSLPRWLLLRILENCLHFDLFYLTSACTLKLKDFFRHCLLVSYDLSTLNSSMISLDFFLYQSDLKAPQNLGWYHNPSLYFPHSWQYTIHLCTSPIPDSTLNTQSWNQTLSLPQGGQWFSIPHRGGFPDHSVQNYSSHHFMHLLVLLCIVSWDISPPLISDIYLLVFLLPLLQTIWE